VRSQISILVSNFLANRLYDTALPCYKLASTIVVTSDNSLDDLRYRALKDGKKVLAATHELRRGFVLLDPKRIADDRSALASCLEGIEKPGVGRPMSIAHLQDADLQIGLFVTGCTVVNTKGVQPVRIRPELEKIQWLLLCDAKIMSVNTPVITLAHDCQLVEEELWQETEPLGTVEVQSDFVVTPERTLEIQRPQRPQPGYLWSMPPPRFEYFFKTVPPLQELKGMKMAEQILKNAGFGKEEKSQTKTVTAEEQVGIDIVERLMKGYSVG
jgi:5-formyltetrahydrofolate cyclo-ligase